MRPLSPIGTLYGEVFALQIIVQRLVAQEAMRSGHSLEKVLRAEHGQASIELSRMTLISDAPGRAEEMLMHAQSVFDQIYGMAGTSRPGIPKTKA